MDRTADPQFAAYLTVPPVYALRGALLSWNCRALLKAPNSCIWGFTRFGLHASHPINQKDSL